MPSWTKSSLCNLWVDSEAAHRTTTQGRPRAQLNLFIACPPPPPNRLCSADVGADEKRRPRRPRHTTHGTASTSPAETNCAGWVAAAGTGESVSQVKSRLLLPKAAAARVAAWELIRRRARAAAQLRFPLGPSQGCRLRGFAGFGTGAGADEVFSGTARA